MVHHMVQEKHQDKLKTTIIQFIMLTYFLSVIMKDPVVWSQPIEDEQTRGDRAHGHTNTPTRALLHY